MQKILFIAPHLSTGGLPQYLTKKIELIKNEFDVYLIEWVDCTGGRLVITKNKLEKLVPPNKFFTLGEDKTELFNIIDIVQPDIIHLEEIPEYFMDDDIARKLYSTEREYFLVETSHDSSMNTENKLFFPDKFMFVSNWQIEQYKNIDIPKILVEYPIEYIPRPNREHALKRLNLDPSKKHILHIGLFTSRKNQKEFFEYAKALPEYEFHSVGNQADNFKWYWEPLMKEKPDNLTWWNERTDVENFYQSMDLFLFTSRGTANDKETMPLVIREALSYQIPQLLYNLEVYQNYFEDYNTINYLNFNNFNENVKLIKNQFTILPEVSKEEEAYVVCTYPKTQAIIDTTIECIKSLRKDSNRKIIISAHCPVPKILQEMVDYVFYEKNNLLTKHTFYSGYTAYNSLYDTYINLRGEDNDRYHGPACYTSFYNPATFADKLGIKKLYYINFDYILKDNSYIDYISKKLNTHDTFFGEYEAQEGKCYYTYFFASKPEAILRHCNFIETENQYNSLMNKYEAESNGIENLYYHIFKNNINNYIEPREKFESDAKKYFDFEDYSMVEYYTILPTDVNNHFCPWVTISNSKESKDIHYTVEKNGKTIIDRTLEVRGKYLFWDLVKYNLNDNFIVTFDVKDTTTGETVKYHKFKLNKDYFLNTMPGNGMFNWKGDRTNYKSIPKIKIIHLLTQPEEEREQRSIESISKLGEYDGIEYTQAVNKPYTDFPPTKTCNRPNDVQMEPGYYKLAPGHYGCFKAHTDAILSCPKDDNTIYLFFECDALLLTNHNEFIESLNKAIKISQEKDYTFFSFAHNYEVFNEYETHIDAGMFTDAHAYLIRGSKINNVHNKINNSKWDAFDLWVTNNFRKEPKGFFKEPLVFQAKGYSLIDKKISETNIKGDIKL